MTFAMGLEGGLLGLVRAIEELLERKSSINNN
jgi:hypothetical protein